MIPQSHQTVSFIHSNFPCMYGHALYVYFRLDHPPTSECTREPAEVPCLSRVPCRVVDCRHEKRELSPPTFLALSLNSMSASAPSSVHSAETKREGAVRSSNIEEGGMVDALEKAPMPAAATSDAVDDTGSISTKEAGRSAGHHSPDEQQQLEGARLAIVFGALLLSIFLIAIDQTILFVFCVRSALHMLTLRRAVALPSIGSDFNSFSLQGQLSFGLVGRHF